ncbi:hypothetical protein [Pararhodobacter sp.]|uniref:hypothetical protein n=1 Tax=Pararhodobacter sp. TaxID=2127056 RepID=UPI002AFFA8B5|nr:hypothetical protein [Pararhodobacter sp.]
MRFVLLCLAVASAPVPAAASLCNYRLSNMIPRQESPAVEAARDTVGLRDETGGMVFVMFNPSTGETRVGSTDAGRQGNADDGFVARTARVLGAAVAVVAGDSPLVTAGGAVLGAGLEAACFLRDDRVSDYDEVLEVLRAVDASMPPDLFALIEPGESRRDAYVLLSRNDGYDLSEYQVRDLYIVNGQLRHRNWGVNDIVGDITVFMRPRGD